MSETLEQRSCPHADCGCAPHPEHAPFCGLYCQNAADVATESTAAESPPASCSCEHPACREVRREPSPAKRRREREVVTALGRR